MLIMSSEQGTCMFIILNPTSLFQAILVLNVSAKFK